MKEKAKTWFKENSRIIPVFGIIAIVVIIGLASSAYHYNKCVKINRENLRRCESKELGDYDCSVFENAEELCRYVTEAREY